MEHGWIGVDLDGTLAEYHGWVDATNIGKPIPLMIDRVKLWLSEGKVVKIFTARICVETNKDVVVAAIKSWCIEHIGQALEITNVKDLTMIELWDDRCVQVMINTGMTPFEIEAMKRSEERHARAQQFHTAKSPKHQLAPPLRLKKRW